MNDNEFDVLLKNALQKYALNYIDESKIDTTPHEFSPEFEKKMSKLIESIDKPKCSRLNIALKRIATVAACLFVASSVTVMSVDALREKALGFFIKDYGKDSIIKIEVNNSVPEKIEDIYEMTYDLSDYEKTYEYYDDVHRRLVYKCNDALISYSQTVVSVFNNFYSTEGVECTIIKMRNFDATYFKNNHGHDVMIWNNGDYVFYIMTNLGYDKLLEIAYSVQVFK